MSTEKKTFYWNTNSGPSRGAWLVIKQLELEPEIEFKLVNLADREQYKPEFLAINVQHTVPVLVVDNGLILTESRSISSYLANISLSNLYPSDAVARAKVDQRLYFEATFLHPRVRAITRPIIYEGCTTVSENKIKDVEEAFKYMENFLSQTKFIAADHLTIADLHCFAVITTAVGFGAKMGAKLSQWHEQCKVDVKGFTEHEKFHEKYLILLKSKLKG